MITIRKASASDFLAVAALDRQAWLQNRNGEFIPDGEHVWRTWCEGAVTFVATDGDQIVGAAVAFPTVDGPYWMHKVFVDQSRRGEGIGSKLLAAVADALDQLDAEAQLTVDPVNEAALAMYERLGFSRRTFVAGYYRPAEDRFVLTRPRKSER